MKKRYIKPENTVVEIQVESIIAESLENGNGVNGEYAGAREVLISDETTIIARNAWDNEW